MTKKTFKNLFIFQTGHGKGLAKAEILSLLPDSIVDEVNDGFVVEVDLAATADEETSPKQAAKDFLSQMGGIVRITEVIQAGPARMPLNFEEWVVNAISEVAADPANKNRKIRFGLSMHPKSEKILKKTLIGTKKNVQKSAKEAKAGKSDQTAFNVRFVNKDFQNLSSVQAWHQKLLKDNSVELHLFKSEEDEERAESHGKWYLTRTLAIQNFEAYSKRDYDRPSRSAKNGMFPPKLAQILINLAQPTADTTIYDPFCGSGTVMQEAWLTGHMSQGSDLAEAMVTDSKQNLQWLADNFQNKSNRPDAELQPVIFAADATALTPADLPKGDFVVVTETWLGPILEKTLSPLEMPKVHREIEALYEAFFSSLQKVAPGVTVIFAAAYHRDKGERHFLTNLPEILKKYCEIVPLSDHERPSLFYERKTQLVSREIWKVIMNAK